MTSYGLRVTVLTWALGDCTNGGVTGRGVDEVVIRGPEPGEPAGPVVDGPTELATTLGPVLRIEAWSGGYRAVPVTDVPEGHVGWMFGGNFVYTSDSRFPALSNGVKAPIPVHDRSERYADYLRNCD